MIDLNIECDPRGGACCRLSLLRLRARRSASGNFLDNLFGGQQRQQPRSGPDEAEMAVRINQLESQIRQLTGTVEQLQFRNQQLEQQLRAQGGATPPQGRHAASGRSTAAIRTATGPGRAAAAFGRRRASAAAGPGRRGDAFDPSINPNAPGAPRALGGGPRSGAVRRRFPASRRRSSWPIRRSACPAAATAASRSTSRPCRARATGDPAQQGGMLPPPPARNPNATGAVASVLPPSNVPKDYYDLAYGYVLRKDYAYAEDAFQTFLKKYPNDKLVPDAQFWLGESLYQRQRYDAAAEQFLALSTKNSAHPKAPDALLQTRPIALRRLIKKRWPARPWRK